MCSELFIAMADELGPKARLTSVQLFISLFPLWASDSPEETWHHDFEPALGKRRCHRLGGVGPLGTDCGVRVRRVSRRGLSKEFAAASTAGRDDWNRL